METVIGFIIGAALCGVGVWRWSRWHYTNLGASYTSISLILSADMLGYHSEIRQAIQNVAEIRPDDVWRVHKMASATDPMFPKGSNGRSHCPD